MVVSQRDSVCHFCSPQKVEREVPLVAMELAGVWKSRRCGARNPRSNLYVPEHKQASSLQDLLRLDVWLAETNESVRQVLEWRVMRYGERLSAGGLDSQGMQSHHNDTNNTER